MLHHRSILELIGRFPEPLLLVGGSGESLGCNRSFVDLFSPKGESPEGLPPLEQLLVDYDGSLPEYGEFSCRLNGPSTGELAARARVIPLWDDLRLLRFEPGEESVLGSVGSFHRQRLETLGMLAGGVAHDFNNVLAGILGHITYLKTILPTEGNHTESLQAIEDGARKASTLTQQILDFSKLETSEKPENLDLVKIVDGAYRLLKGATSPRITLTRNCPDEPVHVLGVEGKIAQVIVNLMINARDAVGNDGSIEISVSVVKPSEELLTVFGVAELSAPEYACIFVQDNGAGMSDEVLKRIFEPYFSTKLDRGGTGLGLSTVLAIVEQLGGAIRISSELEVGTSVEVFLPMIAGDGEHITVAQEPRQMLASGTESILIIDDEYPVRNVISMSLEHLGYEVASV